MRLKHFHETNNYSFRCKEINDIYIKFEILSDISTAETSWMHDRVRSFCFYHLLEESQKSLTNEP